MKNFDEVKQRLNSVLVLAGEKEDLEEAGLLADMDEIHILEEEQLILNEILGHGPEDMMSEDGVLAYLRTYYPDEQADYYALAVEIEKWMFSN